MAIRYVIRTVDEDWIDLVDEPVRIDDRRAAWAEVRRRIAADPDLKTVVINRDNGAILWQSDPDVPPRYRVATADRTYVYAIDDVDFPIEVLSEHKEKDDAFRPGDVFQADGGDREGAGELEIALQVGQPHDLGRERERPELAARRQAHPVADGVGAVGIALGYLLDLAAPEAVGRPLRRVPVRRGQHHAGAAEPRDGLGAVPAVEVAQRRSDLDPEHEAAAELARLGEAGLERGHLVQGGQLVEDHPDAPPVVLGQRQHGVDRDLKPGRDQPAQGRVLVAPGREEQEALPVLVRDPIPDREGLALVGQELEGGEIGGQHGAHAERGLGVVGIDDGLRDRTLHRLGKRGEVGLEQVVDQDPVVLHPLLAQHARAVGEELPCGGDPERVHRVLLLRDQGRGHHVEVARSPGLQEGRPARRPCVERVHQHVAGLVEEGGGVGTHLVVDHAALAPFPDLGHQVRDQHRLARARGAGDDRVLGLGPLRIRDAGDAVGAEPPAARKRSQQPRPGRLNPAAQLPRRDHLGAPDAPLAAELHAAIPEDREEQHDQPGAGLQAEPGARQQLVQDPLARLQGRDRGGDVADVERTHRAVGEAYLLARVGLVAECELGLGQRRHAGGIPFRAGGRAPQVPGRDDDRGEGGEQHGGLEQLAPHADAVEDGLAAPQRRAADAPDHRRALGRIAGRAARRWRRAGEGAKTAGPEGAIPTGPGRIDRSGAGDSLSPPGRYDRRV